jgi:very-short-patch-repair endonuclease
MPIRSVLLPVHGEKTDEGQPSMPPAESGMKRYSSPSTPLGGFPSEVCPSPVLSPDRRPGRGTLFGCSRRRRRASFSPFTGRRQMRGRPQTEVKPASQIENRSIRRQSPGMRSASPTRTDRARALRRQSTFEEKLLWFRLQGRRCGGHKFVRQEPVGPYFADFCCRDARLIVEVDGNHHAGSLRDAARDQALAGLGYRTLRFPNHEVRGEIDAVVDTILAALERRL